MIHYNLLLEENKILTTKNLILRPITINVAEDIYEYSKDIENTKFLIWPPHKNINETKNIVANLFLNNPLGKWAIELKNTKKLIGIIELRISGNMPTGNIGYIINKKYWGNGYVGEAGQKIIQLAFEILKLKWVFAQCDTENINSEKVLIKLGMKYLGSLPCYLKLNFTQDRDYKNYGIENNS